ncbi:L,D-transpeptidase family protein [Streptomyces sp. B-S-A8]|uniref:L,D-transpeptidase family protein n=1 Tax=Streptomyces solicavernae TaxID=3043614 RepID=A0ABT6RTE1_9ACTN|nr:L,D-transpeptidase family protein [Streptomyces sp. B-S-A8]MDI3387695.1 L,D-transpeptidase family protein [Streptomyces sp. B-S-A8]
MSSRLSSAAGLACSAALAGQLLASPPALAQEGLPPSAPVKPCTAPSGAYQWQLEKKLGLPQDGVQSTRDCLTIRKAQRFLGIKPATGKADLRTYRLVLVHEVRKNPNAQGKCPVRKFRVTCVDLNRQILWVQKGGKLVFAPVPIRSGKNGYETRRGWHKIYLKRARHFSTIYNNAPMPHSQFFSGGQALHGTYSDLFKSGSHGCVNMYAADAKRLFKLLKVGDRVYVWGTKPGTGKRYGGHSDDVLIAQGFGSFGIAEDPTAEQPPTAAELEAALLESALAESALAEAAPLEAAPAE